MVPIEELGNIIYKNRNIPSNVRPDKDISFHII